MKTGTLTDEIMELLLEQWDNMTPTERTNFSMEDAKDWCSDEEQIDGLCFEPEIIFDVIHDFNNAYGVENS